jgi:hypothetical protein
VSSWDSEMENSTGGESPTPDTPAETAADSAWDGESTQIRPPEPQPAAPPPKAQPLDPEVLPVLGVVIIYSDEHESTSGALDSRLGQVYPLREGDLLFLGRFPAPPELLHKDGSSSPPTHSHLFPTGGLYRGISRRHLTIEMDSLGGTIFTDYSRAGIYLETADIAYQRKDQSIPAESHRVAGDETVVLMDEFGATGDADLADRRSHYRLQIRRSPRLDVQDRLTETQI